MHTVQILLKPNKPQSSEIERRFRALSHLHNVCVKHARKLLIQLDHDKDYQNLRNEYISLLKEGTLSKEQKARKKELVNLMVRKRTDMGLSAYGFMSYLKVSGRRYKKLLSSQQVQAEAKRVWSSVEKYLFGNGKSIHFKKYEDFDTISGKSNLNGARFNPETMTVSWIGLKLKCFLPKKKESRNYILESLKHSISYCMVKRKMFASGCRYYLIVVLDGDAPKKEIEHGEFTMGIDPGVSTIAGVSDGRCFLEELAPKCVEYDRKIQELLRHMDTSRRSSNPNKFNADGTINRANREPWQYSSNYLRMRRKLKALYRKKSEYTLNSHRHLCNILLEDSKHFIVEKMHFSALVKRSKKTERQEKATEVKTKDGSVKQVRKYKKKKRFGKSINRRSPALFLAELKQKAITSGGSYMEVNTRTYKASQYNHTKDTYEKIPLNQRMKTIDDREVQRDLYSAFLIKHTDNTFEHPNRERCIEEFEYFADMQDILIEQMKADGRSMKQCFGF